MVGVSRAAGGAVSGTRAPAAHSSAARVESLDIEGIYGDGIAADRPEAVGALHASQGGRVVRGDELSL
jgi:hypothetical protein